MKKPRRFFPATEKVAALKRHLVEKVAICQWALKGDQREALQRRPVGLTGREWFRWMVWHAKPPRGDDSWRTNWQWIKFRRSRV